MPFGVALSCYQQYFAVFRDRYALVLWRRLSQISEGASLPRGGIEDTDGSRCMAGVQIEDA